MRILAIHAHPDDTEILAGGTLALLASRGHEVTIVTMAPGDCGSDEYGADEIAAIRRREAASSAAVIGAKYLCVELRDLAIFSDDPSRRKVVEMLRQVRPHLVITASPIDYLCDHEQTSELVRDACFTAPAPNYDTRAVNAAPALPGIPHLYFMDPINGVDRDCKRIVPDFVIDVAPTFEKKKQMLAQHASQRNWLRKHHGMDEYMEVMERHTRATGSLAGIELGEGFRRYKGHPYPQTPLLEELAGSGAVFSCQTR